MEVAVHLQLRSYQLLPVLRGIVLFFFLLAIFGSGSGSWEDSILCTLFGDISFIHRVTQYHQECIRFFSGLNLTRYLKGFFFKFIYLLFIYFWLCWVFISVRGLSLVVASGGHSSSRCMGLSLSRPLLLRSTGSRHAGSVVVAHGPSCSAACGIFPDQGSNLCPLLWQADSQPLRHQESPGFFFLKYLYGQNLAKLEVDIQSLI